LTKLRGLRIEGSKSQLTDASLSHLRALKDLELLILNRDDFTPCGIAELQDQLPNCRIAYWESRDFPVRDRVGSWLFDE
jgi:hypothetical protein